MTFAIRTEFKRKSLDKSSAWGMEEIIAHVNAETLLVKFCLMGNA